MPWATIIGSVIGGIGSGLGQQADADASMDVAKEKNRGALERLKLTQDFELMMKRFSSDELTKLGETSGGQDFWFGMNEQAAQSGVSDFFNSMTTTQGYTGGPGNQSRAPDVGAISQAGQADVNAAQNYQVNNEYNRSLHNLRGLLGYDTGKHYNEDPSPSPTGSSPYGGTA